MQNDFEVIIIGAGVTGSALAYTLSQFSNIKRIAILDKYNAIAAVNSNSKYNSQTLHNGDIETNYTLEKAVKVSKAANLVKSYALAQNNANEIIHHYSKLLLGVGDEEIETIKKRHELFKNDFPYMRLLSEPVIKKLEPNIMLNRKEPVIAMGVENDPCAVNFGNLSRSFISNARKNNKDIQLYLNHQLVNITRKNDGYQLNLNNSSTKIKMQAKFVVFATGAYSLTYAKKMGYGNQYGLLSVAGSFYFSKQALNGKVYTIQNDKLPFAAVHGDPDIDIAEQTRFGPTALILPKLERYKNNTYLDYLKVLSLDKHIFKAFGKLLGEADIRNYILRNFAYEIPLLGKRLFADEVRKIIPTLQAKNLQFAKGFGGLRPQVIDKNKEQLILGEAHIATEEGLIFNITPSPGASTCLDNAKKDAQTICNFLSCQFDEEQFNQQLS